MNSGRVDAVAVATAADEATFHPEFCDCISISLQVADSAAIDAVQDEYRPVVEAVQGRYWKISGGHGGFMYKKEVAATADFGMSHTEAFIFRHPADGWYIGKDCSETDEAGRLAWCGKKNLVVDDAGEGEIQQNTARIKRTSRDQGNQWNNVNFLIILET